MKKFTNRIQLRNHKRYRTKAGSTNVIIRNGIAKGIAVADPEINLAATLVELDELRIMDPIILNNN